MLARAGCLVLVVAFLPCRAQIVPVISSAGSVSYAGFGKVEVAELHDVDGDGLLDLVSRVDTPLQLVVQRNLGGGAFGPPVTSFTASEDAIGTAFSDLDGDGALDAVVGNPPGNNANLSVLRGDGAGGFSLWAAINNNSDSYPWVALGDLDGDGDGDIVSTTHTQLAGQLQIGAGFTYATESAPAGAVGVPALGDFDVDGFLDVAQASDSLDTVKAKSDLRISLGDGAGGFSNLQHIVLDVRARRTQVLHLDEDGLPDLLVFGLDGSASGEGGSYLFRNVGGSLEQVAHESLDELGVLTQDVTGGDLNGDGCAELLYVRSGAGANEIRLNGGNADFVISVPFTGPSHGVAGLFGDLDGDALADVTVVEIPDTPVESWHFWHNATPVPPVWTDLGQGLAGTHGVPQLEATGSLFALQPVSLELHGAAANAPVALFLGLSVLAAPFKSGTLVPKADIIIFGLMTSPTGSLALQTTWPPGLPSGLMIVLQTWVADVQAPQGYSASNGQQGIVP